MASSLYLYFNDFITYHIPTWIFMTTHSGRQELARRVQIVGYIFNFLHCGKVPGWGEGSHSTLYTPILPGYYQDELQPDGRADKNCILDQEANQIQLLE